ncbi:MAG: hypothetical protein C0624_00710 [Desulfuromonas sp.]|nr:MAG: hypothetical protein C0624_00710 [Desulfuromonas sp.]
MRFRQSAVTLSADICAWLGIGDRSQAIVLASCAMAGLAGYGSQSCCRDIRGVQPCFKHRSIADRIMALVTAFGLCRFLIDVVAMHNMLARQVA